jgi:PUA domain protein
LLRFTKEDIITVNVLKSSVQRGIRKQIQELYPAITDEIMEELMPKKSSIYSAKCKDNISLTIVDGNALFFQHFNENLLPTLRTLRNL